MVLYGSSAVLSFAALPGRGVDELDANDDFLELVGADAAAGSTAMCSTGGDGVGSGTCGSGEVELSR